jgi:hypothetical protein
VPSRKPNLNLLTPFRYFPGSRDYLGIAKDSPLAFGSFEASTFNSAAISAKAGNEIDAGGFANADTLSKCATGCLANTACQAIGWYRRQPYNAKFTCSFFKALDADTHIGPFNGADTARVVVMQRCEDAVPYTLEGCESRRGCTPLPEAECKRPVTRMLPRSHND